MCNMESNHNRPRDQKTQKVCNHEATQKDQEGWAGSAMCPLEGLEENYEGNEIGGETHSAEDGREVGWIDGAVVVEWRTFDGVAEWSVVDEAWGVHAGMMARGHWWAVFLFDLQGINRNIILRDALQISNAEIHTNKMNNIDKVVIGRRNVKVTAQIQNTCNTQIHADNRRDMHG